MGMMTEYYHFFFTTLVRKDAVKYLCFDFEKTVVHFIPLNISIELHHPACYKYSLTLF